MGGKVLLTEKRETGDLRGEKVKKDEGRRNLKQ